MKQIESTQGKNLSTVVRKPNALSCISFIMQTEGARTQTRSRSTYLLAKTPPLVMCAFDTHLGPHFYLNVKCLFFKVLLLHAPLINPAVLKLALHLESHISLITERT